MVQVCISYGELLPDDAVLSYGFLLLPPQQQQPHAAAAAAVAAAPPIASRGDATLAATATATSTTAVGRVEAWLGRCCNDSDSAALAQACHRACACDAASLQDAEAAGAAAGAVPLAPAVPELARLLVHMPLCALDIPGYDPTSRPGQRQQQQQQQQGGLATDNGSSAVASSELADATASHEQQAATMAAWFSSRLRDVERVLQHPACATASVVWRNANRNVGIDRGQAEGVASGMQSGMGSAGKAVGCMVDGDGMQQQCRWAGREGGSSSRAMDEGPAAANDSPASPTTHDGEPAADAPGMAYALDLLCRLNVQRRQGVLGALQRMCSV